MPDPSALTVKTWAVPFAGAGFADHIHLHVVPRWAGDTNYMPVLADTRVMPQSLEDSYDSLVGQVLSDTVPASDLQGVRHPRHLRDGARW